MAALSESPGQSQSDCHQKSSQHLKQNHANQSFLKKNKWIKNRQHHKTTKKIEFRGSPKWVRSYCLEPIGPGSRLKHMFLMSHMFLKDLMGFL
jgi:hypothetical protein